MKSISCVPQKQRTSLGLPIRETSVSSINRSLVCAPLASRTPPPPVCVCLCASFGFSFALLANDCHFPLPSGGFLPDRSHMTDRCCLIKSYQSRNRSVKRNGFLRHCAPLFLWSALETSYRPQKTIAANERAEDLVGSKRHHVRPSACPPVSPRLVMDAELLVCAALPFGCFCFFRAARRRALRVTPSSTAF